MNENHPHVVIVGAGFGGLYAAMTLKREPVRVTVLDQHNYHLFQPLLYQVATAGLSPGDIAYPIRAVLNRQKNTRVLMAEVEAIKPTERLVVLSDGTSLSYDYLILAAGARHSYFGHPEWESKAPGLKSVDDALEIRRRLLLSFEKAEREPDEAKRKELLTFVVVGGGPTGVELAGAIAEIAFHVMVEDFRSVNPRESRIVLIEAGPRVLPSFPEELSAKAEQGLKKMGVDVRTNSPVTSVDGRAVAIGEQRIPADTVLWAAGVTASHVATSLAAPLDHAGRVLVEPDLSVPGRPELFVIGDLAAFTHQTGEPLPGLAPVAIQQGEHAARNIIRRHRGRPTRPFHYVDRGTMATIGRAHAVADLGVIRFSGFIAWIAWIFVHIFFLIGFRNRFVVLFNWAWAYITMQRSARLITGAGPAWK